MPAKAGIQEGPLEALDSSFADGIEARAARQGWRVCGFRWNDGKDKNVLVQGFPKYWNSTLLFLCGMASWRRVTK
jgi:hypothetical protein